MDNDKIEKDIAKLFRENIKLPGIEHLSGAVFDKLYSGAVNAIIDYFRVHAALFEEQKFFKMIFGKDQEPLIDAVLKELDAEVVTVVKENGSRDDELPVICYLIEFRTVYGPYLFGHRQAHLGQVRYLTS